MNRALTRTARLGFALVLLALPCLALQQAKPFIPVEGATLKAKIDNAIAAGRANGVNGRFWVGYQFEVRPGVAVDFEIVNGNGVYVWNDDSLASDPRYETRELGLFMLYDTQRESFIRADVYNLRRNHEYSNYPVYWAGRISNEESLNYLKSIIDSSAADPDGLANRALYALSLHDDARVDAMLMELIRRPAAEPLRTRAISLLGTTPESPAKNTLLAELVRNEKETADVRRTALSALASSRSAAMLPVFQNFYETMTARDLKRIALHGMARSDNSEAAATYLIHVVDGDADVEMQKQAVAAIRRLPKERSVPTLIRIARDHPKMPVRKTAIQVLGQTGDERAVAFFRELLSKE